MSNRQLNEVNSISGEVEIRSSKSLIEIGSLISCSLFCDLDFDGLEKKLYEEVPAICIEGKLMGLSVILSGDTKNGFLLSVTDVFLKRGLKKNRFDISNYLYHLALEAFESVDDIIVIAPKNDQLA